MDRVVIFGATNTGRQIFKDIKNEYDVIAFVDENLKLCVEETVRKHETI